MHKFKKKTFIFMLMLLMGVLFIQKKINMLIREATMVFSQRINNRNNLSLSN